MLIIHPQPKTNCSHSLMIVYWLSCEVLCSYNGAHGAWLARHHPEPVTGCSSLNPNKAMNQVVTFIVNYIMKCKYCAHFTVGETEAHSG